MRYVGICLVLLLSACGQPQQLAQPQQPSETTALQLPVSHNEVMVALVNHAADPIWVAAWRHPESEREWRSLERLALQLQLAGALLEIPGTGPRDVAWAADPAWQSWAGKLRTVGNHAASAVATRDVERVATAGDEIVVVCEGCHMAFKPALPTGGQYGELSPTAQDFED